ncbi:DinB family protein [Roseiflexus sp.]|uniref:DinB family protein n=1 Tax=Roseiflexus sp. TaxID=2562120 RepID=UPI00398A9185
MEIEHFVRQMVANAERIRTLVQDVPGVQACWKPDEASWSILEVIGHLYDEERLDFRVRLDFTLHRAGELWPAIDPQSWVNDHRYNDGDLQELLNSFLAAREDSVRWLRGLDAPNWEAVYEAPFGQIRAGDLLAAWTAHDLLHMRQLVELHWSYLVTEATPYQVEYAGEW